MRVSPWILATALAALTAAAGCDGAASASATGDRGDSAADARTVSIESSGAAESTGDPTAILETTFDDIKFPMEKSDMFVETMLTDKVKSRFDRRIRIRGYMYPTPRKRGLKQFVLVRDNMECCFGPGAALFDCVLVTMEGDATAEYSIRPVAVEGAFRFETLDGPEGRPLAIYQMTANAVQ